MRLPYLFTMVPLDDDNLLHQDDIPTLQILLTCAHFPALSTHFP